jgi:hypothetical protein
MPTNRLWVAALAIIGCCCLGNSVFADPQTGIIVTADDGLGGFVATPSDDVTPHGPAACPVPPGDVVLCQNQVDNGGGPVIDCDTILIQAIRCATAAACTDSFSTTDYEHARQWDLAVEFPNQPFQVRCVRSGVRIAARTYAAGAGCTVNQALAVPSVPVTARVYLDLDTDGGGNATPPAAADLVLLGSKSVNFDTTTALIPTCTVGTCTGCPFGVFVNVDFSDCPVSVPANSKMVVSIGVDDDLTDPTLDGQFTFGCTLLETANSWSPLPSPEAAAPPS